jgi:hypothetical protein
MKQRWDLHVFMSIIRDADPGVLIPVLQKPVAEVFRVIQYGVTEGPEIIKGMMKIVIGHFGIAKRSIISEGPSFFELHLFLFTEGGIEDMDLSAAFQMGKAEMKDLFCRGEMFEGGGEDDEVEAPFFEQARADIAMDEAKIGVVAEDTRGLLQFGEVDIGPDDRRAGDLCQLMGEPAISTAYFKDFEVGFPPGEMADEAAGRLFSEFPFFATGMGGGNLGQMHQFVIGIKPAFQCPDLDVFLFEKNLSQPGVALNLNIG